MYRLRVVLCREIFYLHTQKDNPYGNSAYGILRGVRHVSLGDCTRDFGSLTFCDGTANVAKLRRAISEVPTEHRDYLSTQSISCPEASSSSMKTKNGQVDYNADGLFSGNKMIGVKCAISRPKLLTYLRRKSRALRNA